MKICYQDKKFKNYWCDNTFSEGMDWGDVLECSICLEQLSESNKEPVLTRYYPSARQTFMKWENVYPRKPLFNLSMLDHIS